MPVAIGGSKKSLFRKQATALSPINRNYSVFSIVLSEINHVDLQTTDAEQPNLMQAFMLSEIIDLNDLRTGDNEEDDYDFLSNIY